MLTRFDPFAPFRLFDERFQNEIARFFEGSSRALFAPPVDIYEDKEAFVLKAELPGMRPEEIQIDVSNGVLTLKGERKLEHEDNKDGYHRIERWYGAFQRQFTLPRSVDVEHIEAHSKDGILTIRIPKKDETKGHRIAVKSG